MKKILLVLVMLAVVIAPTFAEKTLIVGTSPSSPPEMFFDKNNKLTGFDYDLVNELGRELGYKIEWVDMQFQGLIPAIMTDKINVIAAGMIATPERGKNVEFTKQFVVPNMPTSKILVRKDNTTIKNIKDLKDKTIATAIGTFQNDYANNNIKGAKVVDYDSTGEALMALLTGKADAYLTGGDYELAENKDKLKAVGEPIKLPGEAFATKKGNTKLRDELNDGLKALEKKGIYQKLVKKWYVDLYKDMAK